MNKQRIEAIKAKQNYSIADLREIMEILRAPGGCPWDREQDHHSIRRNLIEETYEVVEAIDKDDMTLMREELGDLLLQIVFHARIAEEDDEFDLDDVADGICKKLILRHPHIFGDVKADTTEQVLANWDSIKKVEKHQRTDREVLDSVSHSLPSLIRADKIGSKARKFGYNDHADELENASSKLTNCYNDMNNDAASETPKEASEAVGRLLFAAVSVAHRLGVDPEKALADECDRVVEDAKGCTVQKIL